MDIVSKNSVIFVNYRGGATIFIVSKNSITCANFRKGWSYECIQTDGCPEQSQCWKNKVSFISFVLLSEVFFFSLQENNQGIMVTFVLP